jgi:uncharacterized protein Yka (UPF0111/DUF47 family)
LITILYFLRLLYNASALITNSFHGLSFAINFNVPFILEMLNEMKEVNSRLENLVELLGVQDRVITNIESVEKSLDYNYDSVNEKLKNLREISLDYLKDITK